MLLTSPSAPSPFLTGPRSDTTAALPPLARRAMARLTEVGVPRHASHGAYRQPYYISATLTWGEAVHTPVYTRDINAVSVGFIGTVPLPTAAKVSLRLLAPDGRPTTVSARIRRSRPFGNGAWFETHAEFCFYQASFDLA